jgi:hypothetical protein
MDIAAELCVYTNDRLTFEELEPAAAQVQTQPQ